MAGLNKPLRPSLVDKVSLFHDLDMGIDAEKILEYNPVLSLQIFSDYQEEFWVG